MATTSLVTQTSVDTFRAYVSNSFNNMAFPHLIKHFTEASAMNQTDALLKEVATTLFNKSLEKASKEQKLTGDQELNFEAAKKEIHPGKMMRILTTFVNDLRERFPSGYHNFISQLAENHLNKVITPEQNLDTAWTGVSLQNIFQPTLPQQEAAMSVVCGAPGVGKSTYSTILFEDGQYVDTSTDTYSNLIAAKAQVQFGIPDQSDPYKTAGVEGSLVKRTFVEKLSEKLKNHNEEVPNVVISTVKVIGPDVEGFFKSAIPTLNIELLFCEKETAIAHMEIRKNRREHHSPEKVILSGLKDASNQLFSNEYLIPPFQKKYSSLLDFLKKECEANNKEVNINITTTDQISNPSQYLSKKTESDKDFAVVGVIKVNGQGEAQLEAPEDIAHLTTFLNQSEHSVDQLTEAL